MVPVVILISSFLLSACLVAPVSATYCQLDANCRLINKSFSRSSVCQLPERTYIETFSSLPPRFIAEPSSQIAGRTDDYITFECAVSYVSDYQPNFTWEHNGREIKNNYSNEGNSSILRVRNTRSAEGAYRCIVHSEQLKYNMTSRYGYLQIDCSGDGWIDSLLLSTYSNEDAIDLRIAKGATTILECTPNTTLSSPYTTWLRNNNATLDANHIKLPNGGLLVRDFDPPAEEVVKFRCIVISNSCPQMTREFNLRASDGEASPIAPNNQTAVLGSSVSLYCITNSKSSNTWYKDGLLLGSTFNWTTMYGHKNEVLVLSSITMEAEGEYSCVYSDGSTMTAQLIVLFPPTAATIQVSGHTPHNFSLILPSSDHTLSLTCTSDHLSQRTEMTFIWFFRGNPITGSAPPVGVVFRQNGTLLSVTGSEVFGSYQCLATNRGGSAAAVLFIYKDKPNPPSSVTIVRDAYLNVNRPTIAYLYGITVNPPHSQIPLEGLLVYNVEAYIYGPTNGFYNYCSCNYSAVSGSLVVVNFSADEFAGVAAKQLFVRAAIVSSTGGKSDYQPFYDGSTCGTVINMVVPPRPTSLNVNPSMFSDGVESGWSVSLTWTRPTDEQYPPWLYTTRVTLHCEGSETRSEVVLPRGVLSYKVSSALPCCTVCNWAVSFVTVDLTMASNATGQFKTSAIRPTQPPTLNSVERDNSNGQFVINFTLPPRNVSCGETNYFVVYSGLKTASQPLDGCKLITRPNAETAGRYQCGVHVGEELCWQALNVSVAFGNGLGSSNESRPMELPGVSADYLYNFSTLSVTDVTPNEITVSLQVNNRLKCLLSNNHTTYVCISRPPTNSQSCYSGTLLSHTFTGLKGGTQYSIEGHLSVLNVENVLLKSVQQTTTVGVPTSPPRNLTIYPIQAEGVSKLLLSWTAPDKNSLNGEITHYKVSISASNGRKVRSNVTEPKYTMEGYVPTVRYYVSVSTCTVAGCGPAAEQGQGGQGTLGTSTRTIVGVAVGSAVLVLLVLTVICVTLCVCFVKKHRKKDDNYQQLDRRDLYYNSNEEITDEELVSVGGPDGAPSVHSDHTLLDDIGIWDKNARMMEYLKNVEPDIAPSEEDCGPTDLACDSLRSVETSVDIHPDLTEDVSSNHQAPGTASCGQNGTSSPCKSKSHRKKMRDKKEGSMILIQNEQKFEDPTVSHDNSQESVLLQKRGSRFGAEHLQTSPLEAAANLSQNKSTSGQDAISMHSLANGGILENCISDDELLQHLNSTARCEATGADEPLDVPSNPIGTTSYDSVSGYVKNNLQHSYLSSKTEHIDRTDNVHTQLDISASTPLGSGYVDNQRTYKVPSESNGYVSEPTESNGYVSEPAESNEYVQECGLNNTSYLSLPHRSFSQESSYATDLPEILSQDSSVFDESISHLTNTQLTSETNGAHLRSTVSSGVYSTSSTSESIKNGNGYVLESDYSSNTMYRSSSEGYASARATPASPNKQFTFDPEISLDRKQPMGEAQVPITSKKVLLSHPQTGLMSQPYQPFDSLRSLSRVASKQPQTTACTGISTPFQPTTDSLKGYHNTCDLNLEGIYITMDEETRASASKQF